MKRKGLVFVQRNIQMKIGEIDLLFWERSQDTYWLVEVRSRKGKEFRSIEMLSRKKKRRLFQMAHLISRKKNKPVRVYLAEVIGDENSPIDLWELS